MNYCCQHIDDYLDDDLTPDQHSLFELALEGCPSCQSVVADNKALNQQLQLGWNQIDAANCPDFTAKLLAESSEESSSGHSVQLSKPDKAQPSISDSRRPYWSSAQLTVLALTVAILLGSFFYWLGTQRPPAVDNGLGIAQQDSSPFREKPAPKSMSRTASGTASGTTTGTTTGTTDPRHPNSNLDLPSTEMPRSKAEVEFPNSFVGVRVDDPDEDFTLIHVYETVASPDASRR